MVRNKLRNTLETTTANKGLDALKALRLSGYDRDYIEETGPYLAKVLRVEPLLKNNTWVENAVANADSEKSGTDAPVPNPLEPFTKSFVVTARISSLEGRQIGIHDYLPEPEQLGTKEEVKGDFASESAIFNHDVFVPQTLDLPPPELGSYIWVDYLDKQNLADGIYIRQMIPTDSIAFETLKIQCEKPDLAKNTQGAQTGVQAENPGLGKNKGAKPVSEVVPMLLGYQIEDFTKSESFKKGVKKENLLKIVGVAEVITMFFKAIYPKSSIKVVAPITARPASSTEPPELLVKEAAAFCNTGKALRVEVHKDGTPLPKEEIYAAMCLLILKGKLPPGGLGFFQTNKGDGTNKGTATTLRTNKKASDFPHYDLRKTESYWIVSTKNNEQVFNGMNTNINNWINLSKPGRSKTNLPPHVFQAYMKISKKLPKRFPNLDTTLAAIKQKTVTPQPAKTTPPKDAPVKKPEDVKAAPTPPPEKTKEEKAAEEKKQAEKNETPEKVPVAPVVPCPPPGVATGGQKNGAVATTDGGAGAQSLTSGKIGATAGKPPKGNDTQDSIIMQHFGEKEKYNDFFKKPPRKLTMFVLHYTDGHGAALQMTRRRKKRIEKYIALNGGSNAGMEGQKYSSTTATVHFWMGRAGDWVQQMSMMHFLGHATEFNSISIGIENCHKGIVFSKKRGALCQHMLEHQNYIGENGNIGGALYNNKRVGGIKIADGLAGFGLPSLICLEQNYNLLKWITGFTGKGKPRNKPPHPEMNIPMAFPANSSPDKSLCVFNKPIFKGQSAFIWGGSSGHQPNGRGPSGKQSKPFWTQGLKPWRLGRKEAWHHGVTSHQRIPTHADGCYWEYYILARVLGLSPRNAFFATLGAYAHLGVIDHGPAPGKGNYKITFFPTYVGKVNVPGVKGYVAAGKKLWDAGNLTESDINSSMPGTSLFNRNEYDNWMSSARAQKILNHVKKICPKAAFPTKKSLDRKQKIEGVRTKGVISV